MIHNLAVGISFPHMIDPIMQQIPAQNHHPKAWDVLHSGVSQRKVEVKETNPCNPGALPNQQGFYLSRTHSPYGTILIPGLGAC